MINLRYLAHWGLLTTVAVTTVAAGMTAWKLSQTNKVNSFISHPAEDEGGVIPEHEKAQFAQAYYDAQNGQTEQALTRLTQTVSSDDPALEAATYYNRANIHLREAVSLPPEDTGKVALIGLAKQDYRKALLVDPSLWDARFNLEYSLLMSPEETDDIAVSEWGKKGSSQVIVKVVGFRVDLP